MVEDGNKCAICGCPEHCRAGKIPNYFCRECFLEHKAAILLNVPWVKYLANAEKQRRKRRNRLLKANMLLIPVYASELRGGGYGRYS